MICEVVSVSDRPSPLSYGSRGEEWSRRVKSHQNVGMGPFVSSPRPRDYYPVVLSLSNSNPNIPT